MRFVGELSPGLICIAPPWRSFPDTVSGLVEALVAARQLPAASGDSAVQAVTTRESEASTALLDIHAGVPHARLPGVTRALVALAVSPAGLYEAVPTVPIQIVALVLSPPGAVTGHLDTLAGIATLLRSAELRADLLAAADGAAALRALQHHARSMP